MVMMTMDDTTPASPRAYPQEPITENSDSMEPTNDPSFIESNVEQVPKISSRLSQRLSTGIAARLTREPRDVSRKEIFQRPSVLNRISAPGKHARDETSPPPVRKFTRLDQKGNRLFGVLKNTLQKACNEQVLLQDTIKKRNEILTSAQDRLRREKEEVEKQVREERDRKREHREIKREEDEIRRALNKLEDDRIRLAKHQEFLQSDHHPQLFWRPTIHTRTTQQLLQRQVKQREEKYETNRKNLEQRLKRVKHKLQAFEDQYASVLFKPHRPEMESARLHSRPASADTPEPTHSEEKLVELTRKRLQEEETEAEHSYEDQEEPAETYDAPDAGLNEEAPSYDEEVDRSRDESEERPDGHEEAPLSSPFKGRPDTPEDHTTDPTEGRDEESFDEPLLSARQEESSVGSHPEDESRPADPAPTASTNAEDLEDDLSDLSDSD